ncbi:hypothetical protein HII13_002372 [Brettanomyces bruxellensis]|uniref:Uncharacterized protein n=1 Tax=Dekkera bruxellensis TaxID=5007 RepID=A0A8H6EVJ7_DEKBR|nr:hypothetical protein HII13_002372 [Brettanomyces bruxellensis]KAF6012670.1 hypothetical protein HII12_002192 [Brettanomyces bruxellensis]
MSYNNNYNNPYAGGSRNPYGGASSGNPYGGNAANGNTYAAAPNANANNTNSYAQPRQYGNGSGNPSNNYQGSAQNGMSSQSNAAGANPYQNYELQGDSTDFFSQIQNLKDDLSDYNDLIDRLERLQVKSLNAIGSEEISSLQNQIDSTSANLEDLQKNTIRPKLQKLYKTCGKDTDKQRQAENLTQQFRTAITRLAKIEDGYNQSTIQKAVDQYQIVNPQASEDQARQFVDQVGNQQVFDNAIALSNRKGEAMTVLQEVQARHQEVQRTEKMAAELNQLFSELQNLVFEQDEMFDLANQNIDVAQDNLERGDANVIKARDHAKKGRKWRWILFWIIVIIILAIVGGVVGGVLGSRK